MNWSLTCSPTNRCLSSSRSATQSEPISIPTSSSRRSPTRPVSSRPWTNRSFVAHARKTATSCSNSSSISRSTNAHQIRSHRLQTCCDKHCSHLTMNHMCGRTGRRPSRPQATHRGGDLAPELLDLDRPARHLRGGPLRPFRVSRPRLRTGTARRSRQDLPRARLPAAAMVGSRLEYTVGRVLPEPGEPNRSMSGLATDSPGNDLTELAK